ASRTPIVDMHPGARDFAITDRRILRLPYDRARLLDGVDVRDLDAHDPLVEDRRDAVRVLLVDAHDRRDVGGLEPAGEIGDRLEVEGAVLLVDRDVVEARRLDDPRHAARRELLE